MRPSLLNVAPRMKLPPPTTTASCTPAAATALHWRATSSIGPGSIPPPPIPPPPSVLKPSPLIFSSTRL